MENLLNSAEIVSSNRIYNQISRALAAWIQPKNAILLVPAADRKSELQLVDVIGQLPRPPEIRRFIRLDGKHRPVMLGHHL